MRIHGQNNFFCSSERAKFSLFTTARTFSGGTNYFRNSIGQFKQEVRVIPSFGTTRTFVKTTFLNIVLGPSCSVGRRRVKESAELLPLHRAELVIVDPSVLGGMEQPREKTIGQFCKT